MTNITNEQILEIRNRLIKFLKENPEYSDRIIGKNTGYSATTINQFRNDKYPNTSSLGEIALKIENFLNNVAQRTETISRGHLKFAPTNASQRIFKVISYCLSASKLGLVTGEAGLGKSITVQEYCRKNPTAILIQVTPVINPKSLLEEMASQLKIQSYHSRSELFNAIVARLQDTNRFIIIDEGENLTIPCLEVVRRIHDFTNVGMLLLGTSRLQRKLRGERGQLQQLYSRIGVQIEIKNFDLSDVKAILSVNFPEGLRFANTFLQLSKQNGRLLEHLIHLTKVTIAETGEELSEDLIDDAASSLLI